MDYLRPNLVLHFSLSWQPGTDGNMRLILTTFQLFLQSFFFCKKVIEKFLSLGSKSFRFNIYHNYINPTLQIFSWEFFCLVFFNLRQFFIQQQTNSSIWKKTEMVCCWIFPINLILCFDCAEFSCQKRGRQTFVCISWWSLFAFLQHTKKTLGK